MNTAPNYHVATRQQGFSLIEVLVALLVLSIGLLGLASLQTLGIRYSTESYQFTQATVLGYDIVDRMRANPPADGVPFPYAGADTATNDYSTAGDCLNGMVCDAAALASYDLKQWQSALQATLTAGNGTITDDGGNLMEVVISWQEQEQPLSITLQVQL